MLCSKKLWGVFFAFFTGMVLLAQSQMPQIRKSTGKVFDAKGKAIVSAWKNADTFSNFYQYRTTNRAIYQTRAQFLYDDKNLYCNIESDFEPSAEYKPKTQVSPFPEPGSNSFSSRTEIYRTIIRSP